MRVRETETDGRTGRQTDRQRQRQISLYTHKCIYRYTDIHMRMHFIGLHVASTNFELQLGSLEGSRDVEMGWLSIPELVKPPAHEYCETRS